MKQLIRVMKALTDPNRLRMMKMLDHQEMCVCEICAALAMAQPTVSNHLRVLERAGLVTSRKEGLWVNYRLADPPDSAYAQDMQRQIAAWLNDEPGIVDLLARLPTINRRELTRKGEGTP